MPPTLSETISHAAPAARTLPATAPSARLTVSGKAPCSVVIGAGVSRKAGELLGTSVRVALVHPPVAAVHARRIAAELEQSGRTVLPLVVPPGEAAKDAGVLVYLWSRLAEEGFTRSDAIVAVGGGATTDLAGFLAASWLRGVPLTLVPSTLLGMVDAAIGGRTAINMPRGKNLVGAFHTPDHVLCDLDLLQGMERADYVSGLAGVIKAGMTGDPGILDLVEADPRAATDPRSPVTAELVERAVRVKAGFVAEPPHGHGRPEFLDYGHTLAHAVEHAEGYRVRHGHAVAIGMSFAAELAALDGRLDPEHVERQRELLVSVGLPTGCPRDTWERLRPAFAVDNEPGGHRLRLVVEAPGRPVLLENPEEALLTEAFSRIGT
ncbi:3-dehydroquinate synthase family protein [Streptomyces sp. NPDC049887]|uniref:3-dehydroquinate synthase family protein n=1 Tax=Streptomyces sp. NPDC049887 TaxID=3155654 RepID=UPI0034455426